MSLKTIDEGVIGTKFLGVRLKAENIYKIVKVVFDAEDRELYLSLSLV